MSAVDELIELATALRKRPGMFVGNGGYDEVAAYICGYSAADRNHALGDEGWKSFAKFIHARFGFPSKYVWPYVVRACSSTDEDAIQRLCGLLIEFCEMSREKSFDEIIAGAASQSAATQEREPEIALRGLLRVLPSARREEIEPLVLEHPGNPILWKNAYPDDIAQALNTISDSYPIARISGDEGEGRVELMTADYPFPIFVQSVDGKWQVDATQLIELTNAQQDGAGQPATRSESE